jgi:putative PEP-CTERM system TPR-repeat lipoprotein
MTHHPRHAATGFLLLTLLLAITAVDTATASLDEAGRDWRQGDAQSAMVRLKDLLQREPENLEARLLLARIYLDNHEAEAAEQQAMHALDSGADPLPARILLVEALALQGETGRALEWATVPDHATPAERAELLALRGHILLARDEETQAADAFQDAFDADPTALRALLGRATMQLRRGDMAAARATLERAIALHAQDATAWRALSKLEIAEQQPEAAVEALSNAMTYARVKWPLQLARAELYLDLGDVDAAPADISAVRSVRPGLSSLDYLTGRLALLRGDYQRAVERLEAFLNTAPLDPSGVYYAAIALNLAGRPEKAEQYLSGLVASLPEHAHGRVALAQTRLALGDAIGAERAIRPAAEAFGATPLEMELLRASLAAQGRHDDAEAVVGRAAELFPDLTSIQLAQAARLQMTGNLTSSLTLLRGVLDAEPDNARARSLSIHAHLALDDTEAAMVAADAYLARSPQAPMAHMAKAVVLMDTGDLEAARDALENALELEPSFAPAAIALAALETGADPAAQAHRPLEQLLLVDPDNVAAILALAKLEEDAEGASASQARLRAALERHPKALLVRLALVRSVLKTGDKDTALELLNQAPEVQRQDTEYLWAKAQAQVLAENWTAAIQLLNKLAERLPALSRYRYMLASVYAEIGDLRSAESNLELGLAAQDQADALEHDRLARILAAAPTDAAASAMLDRLLPIAPDNPTLQAAKGRLFLTRGDFGEAEELLSAAASAHPDDATIALWQAKAIARTQGPSAARDSIRDWSNEHPDDLRMRLALADFSIATGDTDLAAEQYRYVLARDGDNAPALNNLAMLLADTRPDEAKRYAERLLALTPEDANALDTMGTVLMAGSDFQGAAAVLAKAHARSPDPSIALNYAKALAGAGETREARRLLLEIQQRPIGERAEVEALLQAIEADE